jgi:ATP-dependent RNA helicase MSS116, mitochondrial
MLFFVCDSRKILIIFIQLVLDEADTILDMGFRDDLEAIVDCLPAAPERQTFLFSATISNAIQQIARKYLMKGYTFIKTISADDSPVHDRIPQYYSTLESAEHQLPHVLRLIAHDQLANPGLSKVIVFLPTTKMTQLYADTLREVARDVFPGGRASVIHEIHSKKDQSVRSRTSERFRQDRSGASILVTSDVSARGVDYPGVTRVIQIGVPGSTEQYIHRVDLVLLPFEARFVQSQLSQVPLKEATVEQVTAELQDLAEQYDATPATLSKTPRRDKYYREDGPPRAFVKPVTPRVTTIGEQLDQVKPHFDQTAVREAFVSMLGYYVTKSVEMQTSKTAIIDGLKDWTTDGMGLSQPPYISQEFLKKIGGHDRGSFGGDRRGGRSRSAGSWGDRGSSGGGFRERSGGSRSSGGDWEGGFKPRFGDREGGSPRPRFGGDRDGGFKPRSSEGGFERKSFSPRSEGSERRTGGFPLRGRSDDGPRRRSSWNE